MARPLKDPANAKSVKVDLRLTLADKTRIEDKARKARLSTSEFIRRASLGSKITNAPKGLNASRMDAETLAELNRWGVNLNQIAKHMNRGGETPAAFDQVLFQLYQLIENVGRKF